jgi:hypothetical protein
MVKEFNDLFRPDDVYIVLKCVGFTTDLREPQSEPRIIIVIEFRQFGPGRLPESTKYLNLLANVAMLQQVFKEASLPMYGFECWRYSPLAFRWRYCRHGIILLQWSPSL